MELLHFLVERFRQNRRIVKPPLFTVDSYRVQPVRRQERKEQQILQTRISISPQDPIKVMGIYLKCAPRDEQVFRFLVRKRYVGKPIYVYMTAAANKFQRCYYAKVRDYLDTLEDLPPVDMDYIGLQGSN